MPGTLEVTGEAGFSTADPSLASWRNPGDMELGFVKCWSHMICPVSRIERQGDRAILVMSEPAFLLACRKGGMQAGQPDYIENALELLDEPGEWYYDRTARRLHYMPLPGEDIAQAEVIAPVLETLVEVRGSLEQPAHDIRFEGLTLAHATWLRPTQFGHPDVQANFIIGPTNLYLRPEDSSFVSVNGDCVRSPANVQVVAAQRVGFEGCTFTHLGSAGLDLQEGTQASFARGCIFRDISGSGVQVGDVTAQDHHPSDDRRTVRGNEISNCLVTQIGAEYEGSIGIFCGYTDGTTLAHNEICDLPYSGISVGWGWGMTDAGGSPYYSPLVYDTPTACRGNHIEYNHIHHCMLRRNDGGAIYTLSRQPGTIVRGNHIHDDGPGGPGGIYLDEGSSEIEVTGNLVYAVAAPMNYNNHAQNRTATCNEHDDFFGRMTTPDGVIGKALAGPMSTVDIPPTSELAPPQMTVEAWVRLPAYPTGWDPRWWAFCQAGNEWADGNLSLYVNGAKVGAYLNLGGGPDNCFEAQSESAPMPLGQWCPIALTFDGQTLRVYCEGQQVAEQPVGRTRPVLPSAIRLGGRQDGYSCFGGNLDEVRLYGRALSPAELAHNIQAVRAAAPGQEPAAITDGLLARWGFDDTTSAQQALEDQIVANAGLEPAYRHLSASR